MIVKESIYLYEKFVKKQPNVFRAGRYGMCAETYRIIGEFAPNILDLSYSHGSGKMCHLTYNDTHISNKSFLYKGTIVLPNTSYLGFRFFKKRKRFILDMSETQIHEFKTILKKSNGNDLVITMHSWNFIKKYFFNKNKIYKDADNEKKFRKISQLFKEKGYTFSSLNDYKNEETDDFDFDLTRGLLMYLKSIVSNFCRFKKISRLNKKYFAIYFVFYTALACFLSLLIVAVVLLIFYL